ncbi:hypothetical protein H0A61_02890 [Koleobacter methoxysyntrophicus]|uniref:Uncharacterized protein n=1 Tax=Koleobacter methoxysyntrophicus TaxID=2751313 RepID=A0A8A0RRG1_9FIRM|nr:hypothetical protein [Koleobacter methoxysyntrophicus]QSQ10482.1 hypothetical protein H0A61_02890 [Koleobacter methoxysyntrophicus]
MKIAVIFERQKGGQNFWDVYVRRNKKLEAAITKYSILGYISFEYHDYIPQIFAKIEEMQNALGCRFITNYAASVNHNELGFLYSCQPIPSEEADMIFSEMLKEAYEYPNKNDILQTSFSNPEKACKYCRDNNFFVLA